MPEEVFLAVLFGKRIAIPSFFPAMDIQTDTSLKFLPLYRKQCGLYLDPNYAAKHGRSAAAIRRAAGHANSQWTLLPTVESRKAWAEAGKSVLSLQEARDLNVFVGDQCLIDRAHSGKGSYEAALLAKARAAL
jgi:hypothetical protein